MKLLLAGVCGLLAALNAVPALGQVSGIASGPLATTVTCEAAAEFQAKLSRKEIKPTADEILTYTGTAAKCGAEAYNQVNEEAGSPDRMLPVAKFAGEGPVKKVAFDLVKISAKDEAQLRMLCKGASVVMGGVVGDGDPLLTPVLTQAGKYSCGSYLESLISSDPLLLVAPNLVPGVAITKDVLVAVGIPRETLDKAEEDIKRELGKVGRDYVNGQVTILTGGLVNKVPDNLPEVKLPEVTVGSTCMRVWGKKICS